jgi:hypothetical protein
MAVIDSELAMRNVNRTAKLERFEQGAQYAAGTFKSTNVQDAIDELAGVTTGSGTGAIADSPMDGTTYGRNNGIWVHVLPLSGGTMSGPLILQGGSAALGDAPSDGTAYGRLSGTWSHVLALSGGTMTGSLVLQADPTIALGAATKQYVDSHVSGILGDAPSDGNSYGRLNAAWTQVLPIVGGTLTGPLTVTSNLTPIVTVQNSSNVGWQFIVSGGVPIIKSTGNGSYFQVGGGIPNYCLFQNTAGGDILGVLDNTSANASTNYIQILNGSLASPVSIIQTQGGSTNRSIQLVPNGTGTVQAPTMASTDNSTAIATTAFVKSVTGTGGVGVVPENSKSANYTTVLGDAGQFIYHPSSDANARTFTVDSNANVAYSLGTVISFVNMSANALTIAITADTMYLAGPGTTGSRTLAQYGCATALKTDTTAWIISGTGLT